MDLEHFLKEDNMKLDFKVFGQTVFTHPVQTKEIEKVFAGLCKVPHKDFETILPLLVIASKRGNYYNPRESVSIDLEAFQIANLLKNIGHIGSEVPESEASFEVTC
jgi:hypothetical protein